MSRTKLLTQKTAKTKQITNINFAICTHGPQRCGLCYISTSKFNS